jgi:hypothetical protein
LKIWDFTTEVASAAKAILGAPETRAKTLKAVRVFLINISGEPPNKLWAKYSF